MIEGEYSNLKSILDYARSSGIFIVPYSSTNVEELTKIKSRKEQEFRLNYLSELTDDHYFENSALDFGLVKRHPVIVYKTLNDVWFPDNIFRTFGNLIKRSSLTVIRKLAGIDPIKLNNVHPENVFQEIDNAILSSKLSKMMPDEFKPSPTKALLTFQDEEIVRRFGPIYSSMGGNPRRAIAPDIKIAGLYSLLETFGYWPESKRVYEKASRFNDASHCFYSLWSEICISIDQGFTKKSNAVACAVGSNVIYSTPELAYELILKSLQLANKSSHSPH